VFCPFCPALKRVLAAFAHGGPALMGSSRDALPTIVTRELVALRKLSPPLGEQNAYAALVNDFSQLNGLLQRLSLGARSPEVLTRGRELAARAAVLAGPLGLAVCTSPQ
jgi:hypothetical protein